MGRIIGVIIGLCLMANCMWAQTPAESINAIKMQTEVYVYAESSSATIEEALDFAKTLLKDAIQGWLTENNIAFTEDMVAKAEKKATVIEARRGSMFRAFLYVSKEDLEAIGGTARQAATPPPANSIPNDIPTIQHEAVVNNDDLAGFEELSEVSKESSTNIIPKQENVITVEEKFQRTPLEDDILAISHAQNIQPFIKKLQSENRISRFGKYADMPSDINCYLFVYDRNMNIPAYLRKEGAIYINLKTGEMDDVANYKGCGAIWFRIRN